MLPCSEQNFSHDWTWDTFQHKAYVETGTCAQVASPAPCHKDLAEMSQAWAVYSQTSIQDFPLVSGVSSHMLSQIVSFEGEPGMLFKINSPEEAKIAKQD